MPDAGKRPCLICRRWFRPDPRVGARQRACRQPECQAARRRKTQAAWRALNPDYLLARRIQARSALERVPAPLRWPPPLAQLPWDLAQDQFRAHLVDSTAVPGSPSGPAAAAAGLAGGHGPLEEGWLLAELLPETVQQQVRAGQIAAHIAMKFLVPVARASLEDCQRMAAAFARHKFTTRQAGQLYAAWRDASPAIRQRILDEPQLFLKAQRQVEPEPAAELMRDLEMGVAIANRAGRRLAGAGPGLDYAHPYLAGRGIDRATAAGLGVGFYGGPGLLSGRIVIPIANARGARVAYAGRALDGQRPKYKLPAGFRKGSWLSAQQEKALLERFERVVLLLDGDAAGRAASRAIAARLSRGCPVAVVRVPDGAQPDQLSLTAIQQLLGNLA